MAPIVWGMRKAEVRVVEAFVQGDIASKIGSSEFGSHWLQSCDNMLLPVLDFPFKGVWREVHEKG